MIILEQPFTTVDIWYIWYNCNDIMYISGKLISGSKWSGCFLYINYNQVGAALSNLTQYVLTCYHWRKVGLQKPSGGPGRTSAASSDEHLNK